MSAITSKNSIDLRSELSQIYKPDYHPVPVTTWFVGDGSTTDFELAENLVPFQVFDAGALMKDGSGEDYEVTDNGIFKTIAFAVAPTNLSDICVVSYVRIK